MILRGNKIGHTAFSVGTTASVTLLNWQNEPEKLLLFGSFTGQSTQGLVKSI